MIFLWILLGILALFFLLSMLPLHAILTYQEDATLTLSVLFLKIRLFPAKKTPLKKARKKKH